MRCYVNFSDFPLCWYIINAAVIFFPLVTPPPPQNTRLRRGVFFSFFFDREREHINQVQAQGCLGSLAGKLWWLQSWGQNQFVPSSMENEGVTMKEAWRPPLVRLLKNTINAARVNILLYLERIDGSALDKYQYFSRNREECGRSVYMINTCWLARCWCLWWWECLRKAEGSLRNGCWVQAWGAAVLKCPLDKLFLWGRSYINCRCHCWQMQQSRPQLARQML